MQNKLITEIKDEIGLDYWIILLPPHKKQIQCRNTKQIKYFSSGSTHVNDSR